jgi:hypothetical protein
MKGKAPDVVAATARSPLNWFLGICLAAFLTIISASAANAKTNAEELNPAEQWVVTRVRTGELANPEAALNADRTKKFPEMTSRGVEVFGFTWRFVR